MSNLSDLFATAKKAAIDYRNAFNSDIMPETEKVKFYNTAVKAVNDYNNKVREEAYTAVLTSADPIFKALEDFSFPGIKRLKITWDETKTKISDCKVDDIREEEIFSLTTLETFADASDKQGKVFHDETWKDHIGTMTQMYNSVELRASGAKGTAFKNKKAPRADMITTYKIGNEAVTCNTRDSFKFDVSMKDMKKITQAAIDAVYFADNGKGENKYLVKSEDVMYIYSRITKYNPKTHRATTVKQYAFSLLFDVLAKLVCKYGYIAADVR